MSERRSHDPSCEAGAAPHMTQAFRFKARLSPSAIRKAEAGLAALCDLHNAAIQERRDHWKAGLRVGFYSQSKQLKEIRRDRSDLGALPFDVAECALKRVHLAFEAFFRRVKAGEVPGYPRFQGRGRYDSMTFRQWGWKRDGRRLTLSGIGTVKLFLSRPIEGRVKTVTIRRDLCGDWWVCFACDQVPAKLLPTTGHVVGVDLGLATFAALSSGETVANPRHLRTREAALKRAQRVVARRERGGTNRRKAVRLLAKRHRRLENARRDFHWKTARSLVQRFDTIAVEDLNVSGLARSTLAKSVHDAGWGGFLHALAVKAEEAGRIIVAVDPRGTSQVCSGCGVEVRKSLAMRVHDCPSCGLTLDRDVNAARNILARAGPTASCPASEAAA